MTKTRIETIKFLPHDPSQSGLSEKSFDISYDDETGLYSTEEVNKSRLSTPKSPFKDSNKLHLPKNFKILPKELSLKELSISLENSQLGKFEAGTELDTVETHVNQHKEVDQKIRESVVHPNPPETLDLDKYRFFYNEDDNTEPMISDNKMITSLDPANPKEAIERLNARNLFSLNDEETKLKSKPVTTTDELLEPVKSFFPADLQFLTAKINEEAQNVDYKQKLKDAILIIIDTQVSRTLKSITQRPEDKKINDLVDKIIEQRQPDSNDSFDSDEDKITALRDLLTEAPSIFTSGASNSYKNKIAQDIFKKCTSIDIQPIYQNRNTLEFFDIEIPKTDKTTRTNKDVKEKPESWTKDSSHLIEEITKKIDNLRSNYERLLRDKVTEITAPKLASNNKKEEIDRQITAAFLKINNPSKAQKKPGPVSDGIEKVNLKRLIKEIEKIIEDQITDQRIVKLLKGDGYFTKVAEEIIQKSKNLASNELKSDKKDLEKTINKRVKDIKRSNANTANANAKKYQAMSDNLLPKLLTIEFSTTNYNIVRPPLSTHNEWIKRGIEKKKFRSQEDVKEKIKSSIGTITNDSTINSVSSLISATINSSDSIGDFYKAIFTKLNSWIFEATGKEELLNEIFYNQLAKLLPEFNSSNLPDYIKEDGSDQYYIDYARLDELAKTDDSLKEIISKAHQKSIKEAAIQIRKIIESSKKISKRHKELSEEFQGGTSKPSQLTQLDTISYIDPLSIRKTSFQDQYLNIRQIGEISEKIKTFDGSPANTDSINIEISKIEKSYALKLEQSIALKVKSNTLLNSLPEHLKINFTKQVTKKLLEDHSNAKKVLEEELRSIQAGGYTVPQGSDINILVNEINQSIKNSLEKIQPECQKLKKRILKEQIAILDHNLEVTKYNKDLHVQEHQEDFLERTTALALNILYNKKKVNFVPTGTFALNDVITQEFIIKATDAGILKAQRKIGSFSPEKINQVRSAVEKNLAKFIKCYHEDDFIEKAKKELKETKVSDIDIKQNTVSFSAALTRRRGENDNTGNPISDKDYYVGRSENYKNQIEYYSEQKDIFIAELPSITVPSTGATHTAPISPTITPAPATITPTVGGRPTPIPSSPRAPMSVEVKAKTVKVINSFLNPDPTIAKSTEQKQVDTIIQKNLKNQEDNPIPDEAYLGLGFIAEFKENGHLIVQSVMKGKNPKRFKEHRAGGVTIDLDEDYLKDQHIAKIWDKGNNSWFEPTNDEASMKKIAKIFHENKDTYFTLGNGRTVACAAKDKEVFVTNLCESAKITSTSELSGARYNPDTHGIEAVDKDDEIPKISQRMISAAASPSQ